MGSRLRWTRLAAAFLTAGCLGQPFAPPAQASLLGPVLRLLQPRLEQRLTELCLSVGADGLAGLERTLQEPCRRLAGPTSACLIAEAENSGRSFGVITELVGGRFGGDSEVVVKRCAARLLGLPADSLRDVSLQDLQRRFRSRSAVPDDRRQRQN